MSVGRIRGRRRSRLGVAAAVLTLVAAVLAGVVYATRASTARAASAPAATHTITYDNSLIIDGKRTFIWSGEFEYWRLPTPNLWLDILQKMKAEGYNAVTMYFDWAYHSPKSGVYHFSGVRNVNLLLDLAQQVGLYVIARPGPTSTPRRAPAACPAG